MKLPDSARNWTSILGAALALTTLFVIIFLFIISILFDSGSSYLGLFTFIILPVFLVIGLFLIPIGMIFTSKRKKSIAKTGDQTDWPIINLNLRTTRNALTIFVIGSVIFFMLSGIGSYEAFHYTESVEFCGTLCHKVMEPEFVAYHQSSHERVKCVECHVGAGADWYVKSKLSGLYQIYSVAFKKYPQPIPTPIHNLRPARETCEQCHWPDKFYDPMIRMKKSYLSDYDNTEWDIHLMMKTSATYSALGLQEGIHWHINPDVQIDYITDLEDPSKIPWVRSRNKKTGEEKIFLDSQYSDKHLAIDAGQVKTMDCMDCHNRPSHNYKVPQNFVDDLITAGSISTELPDIKYVSMEILYQDYETKEAAFDFIQKRVKEYYEENYDYLLEDYEEQINQAIAAIQTGFSQNIFPYMKVNWSVYPTHLGHMESDGCYRCHSDRHSTSTGETISRDCQLCHNIIAQGTPSSMEFSQTFNALDFKHPIEIRDAWRETLCSECHFKLY